MSTDFLAEMAELSLARVVRARADLAESALRARALAAVPAPKLVLGRFDVMAEVKLKSPSAGVLMRQPATALGEVWSRARAYHRGGACAVSVLTEPTRFDGSMAQLSTAARAVPIPVMRKDFMTDPWQVYEARAAGAGGVLVIMRIADDALVAALVAAARECGMFALLEAFDADDLDRAVRIADPDRPDVLVGVNTRDLATLQVDRERLATLSHRLPRGTVGVAESGLAGPDDAAAVVKMGYRMALVGTALMDAAHPAELIRDMLAAGRSAA